MLFPEVEGGPLRKVDIADEFTVGIPTEDGYCVVPIKWFTVALAISITAEYPEGGGGSGQEVHDRINEYLKPYHLKLVKE